MYHFHFHQKESIAEQVASKEKMLVPVCVDGASKEWSIVELQGNLLVDDDGAMANVDIGTLRYTNGVPTIRIGNHILSGKVAKLPKPFAILQKDGAAQDGPRLQNADDSGDAGTFAIVVTLTA